MLLAAGERIDRYELTSLLGGGAQGAVWRATRVDEPAQVVALKLIELRSASAADVKRARREARALAELVHPSLVRCHGTFDDVRRGILGLVLDFVDGVDAETATNDPRFTLAHRFAALLGVARALAFVHSRGLVHRDVKPGNVLLGRDFWNFPDDPSTVKLVDFGIAALAGNRDGLTDVGDFIGTLRYLPPETIDPATWLVHDNEAARDAFAFGVMAWELLVGGHPTGLPRSARVADYARAYRRETPWPPRGPLAGPWGEAVSQCLALDAERRPPSGQHIVELLGEVPEPPLPRRTQPAARPQRRADRQGPRQPPPAASNEPPVQPPPRRMMDEIGGQIDAAADAAMRMLTGHTGIVGALALLVAVAYVLMFAFQTCHPPH